MNPRLKIVFFGTSDFAVPSLIKLRENNSLLVVVTKADKPKGRRLLTKPSVVKSKAQVLNVPLFFMEQFSQDRAIDELKRYDADLFVVVAYGQILPSEILSIPKFYSIGLHASLLPKYRGAAPINGAILNGDRQTGVTVFKLNERMDSGDIILQKAVEILDSDNAQSLSLKLSVAGAGLLLEAIGLIERGEAKFVKQKEEEASFAPKLKKEDGIIDWTESASQVHNRTRAMYNWPGAFSSLGGRTIKIWSTAVSDSQTKGEYKPGEIIKVESSGIVVACARGNICIRELQPEGGRRMSVSEYLRGHKVIVGDRFLTLLMPH